MANNFQLSGAQPQKQTKFSAIYTGRWSSGIWTNRSPLRDAATTRLVEKFYGPAGDALIAGNNIEITNRLTLARRPGNSIFDSNSVIAPNRFEEFHLFNSTSEQIDIMVDQANALYSLFGGVKSLVWTKSAGAGQTFMQSVGNTLYFGNGIDNKKWLQTLTVWTANAQWNGPTTPFLSTFIIDTNGNIQQLEGTGLAVTAISVNGFNTLTVTVDSSFVSDLTQVIVVGESVTFPAGMTASFLSGATVIVTAVNTHTFTGNFTHGVYSGSESDAIAIVDDYEGTPISGGTVPTWNTGVPNSANNFQQFLTLDGSVLWANRGNPVENWGIINTQPALLLPTQGLVWQANTFYSPVSVIVDSNGNLQQVTIGGAGGSVTPTWSTTVGGTTPDGAVTWTMVQNAASLVWQANTDINTPTLATAGFVIATAGVSCLFQSYRPPHTVILQPQTTGGVTPTWPAYSTASAPAYATVTDNRVFWRNLGPVADFVWASTKSFIAAGNAQFAIVPPSPSTITDSNNNWETPFTSGYSGGSAPSWAIIRNSLTNDGATLQWVEQGPSPFNSSVSLTTGNGGWKYSIALVNTLDDTVSNATPLSFATGNFTNIDGLYFSPGQGLSPLAQIDPQADFVAIFRTTDGQSTPFLIPGDGTTYTVTLAQYLASGYIDTTPDTGLNNLISAPLLGENTPPAIGAINLTFHLDRIFYSIGNTVYWTSGPDDPAGNGVNGTNPLNFDGFPSLVKRLVPTTSGVLVFTISDTYIIQGQGTAANPLQKGLPLFPGLGLLSYNALDTNGPLIGLFTTDKQFVIMDPSSGLSYAGFPIGDQLRLNNGSPGQSWNPANAYVAWYINGEDQGWYLADGVNGWYRLMPTPAPEVGYSWSPFATIVGGCKAVQNIETTPGQHNLLLGPVGTGPILTRDLSTYQDNSQAYIATATIGSAVLAQPGQLALVNSVTTDSVRIGTPLALAIILDEALPYYVGPWEVLKVWIDDPPTLGKKSTSFYSQRFYLAEEDQAAACRHLQIQINWPPENQPNELQTLTLYGGYLQEI